MSEVSFVYTAICFINFCWKTNSFLSILHHFARRGVLAGGARALINEKWSARSWPNYKIPRQFISNYILNIRPDCQPQTVRLVIYGAYELDGSLFKADDKCEQDASPQHCHPHKLRRSFYSPCINGLSLYLLIIQFLIENSAPFTKRNIHQVLSNTDNADENWPNTSKSDQDANGINLKCLLEETYDFIGLNRNATVSSIKRFFDRFPWRIVMMTGTEFCLKLKSHVVKVKIQSNFFFKVQNLKYA